MPGTLASATKLNGVDDVVIDSTGGRFKYILCKVFERGSPSGSQFKNVVRGTASAEFHSAIYDDLDAELEALGLSCECLGGGKIEHNPVDKTIVVFGMSQGFGRADHSVAADLLRKKFPDYSSITWKDV
jgi:phosphohistidine phosphatase